MVMIGALVAVGIGKMTFGGLGNNIFNPALVGRVFLFISFPVAMTAWPEPGQWMKYTDAVTGATPLGLMKEGLATKTVGEIMPEVPSFLNLFLGNTMGSAGEVAALALLIGMIYMLYQKDHHLAHPHFHPGYSVLIYRNTLAGQSRPFCRSAVSPAYRGTHAGSHLYGHRLCDLSHDHKRDADLRGGDRDRNRADQGISVPIRKGFSLPS